MMMPTVRPTTRITLVRPSDCLVKYSRVVTAGQTLGIGGFIAPARPGRDAFDRGVPLAAASFFSSVPRARALAYSAAMTYAIPVPAVTSLPILNSDQRFPVRRIFCIGRNYVDHAQEMGSTVDRDAPLFFCKPADALVTDGADVRYPQATDDLHHEVEMVVALGHGGRDVPSADAAALIWGFGVGLDLTRRDLQAAAKARSHPWDVAKAFDDSAPVSALRPASEGVPDESTILRLSVNGVERQSTRLANMVHSSTEIIVLLSNLFELQPGDLIFTGTPAGVAPLQRGDRFNAQLIGFATLEGRVI